MELMSVTLDVSKSSGWLNADALCRVERGMGGGVRAKRREGARGEAGASDVQGKGRDWTLSASWHARYAPQT